MLDWEKYNIVIFSEKQSDVEVLHECGYRTGLVPGDNEPISRDLRGDHYMLVFSPTSKERGEKWSSAGLCPVWQISILRHKGYDGLSDAYREGGASFIDELVNDAVSIYHDEEHSFLEVEKKEAPNGRLSGWSFFNEYLRWTIPEFVVTVGPYGSGKSALAQLLACDFADKAGREFGMGASICAWEDRDWRVKRNIERFARTRNRKDPWRDGEDARVRDILTQVRHITLPPSEARSLDWYFSRCELQIKRYGTGYFVFDPWNEFDHIKNPGENETDYVSRALRESVAFSESFGVIMNLVTHVGAKSFNEDGSVKKFRLAQSQGSSHYGKKAMRGICVQRTKALAEGEDRMIIRFDKSKDEETMGELGVVACSFDRLSMDLVFDPIATKAAKEEWEY